MSAAKLPTENRCPSCNSPDPKRHPATQYEGEVWLCPDPYHQPSSAGSGGEPRVCRGCNSPWNDCVCEDKP